jgi:PKD domain
VNVSASAAAAPGSYEGKVELTNSSTGRVLHVPVWLRVLPANPLATVLLVDDDGSDAGAGFPDYSQVYKDLLASMGVDYQYRNVWTQGFPSFFGLFSYKAVLIFSGNNDSFDTSGFSTANQDALLAWLNSGGKLWTTGQNFAEESDSNGSYSSPSIGRSRLYHGYLGVMQVAPSAYAGAAPQPTGDGKGPLKGLKIDLSPGGDGAGNQDSIELQAPMQDNDTYQAADTEIPLVVAKDADVTGGKTGLAFGRSSDATLKSPQQYRYRSVSMGFGLEGVNSNTGFATRKEVAEAAWRWLSDTITFGALSVGPKTPGHEPNHVAFTASPSSSAGVSFTKFRWDFGDGTGPQDTTSPSTHHHYKDAGTYVVRIEAIDDLGHSAVSSTTINVTK